MQLELAYQCIRKEKKPFLICLPLGVIGEFKRDNEEFFSNGYELEYITDTDEISGYDVKIYVTNYERVRVGDIDPNKFCGVSLLPSNKSDKHWNWKGGITPIVRAIRNSEEMKNWRKQVFQRDGFSCVECGAKGVILHAHHIMPFSEYKDLRFDIDNGITLCKDCHNKKHSKK